MAQSLKEQYLETIKPALKNTLELKNDLEIPKLEKIVINFGLGDSASNAKTLEAAIKDLEMIAGQKPVVTRAKKSIAGFKLRDGMAIGLKVTLRDTKMYNFFSKLVNISLPRVRDFQGVSLKSFDGRGNYTLGIKEQLIFPEIQYDKVDAVRGMDITICTTATSNEAAKELLAALGMPFKKQGKVNKTLA